MGVTQTHWYTNLHRVNNAKLTASIYHNVSCWSGYTMWHRPTTPISTDKRSMHRSIRCHMVPVLEAPSITVWCCNPAAATPQSVWYQSAPPSTWRSSSLSDSTLLKRRLETLSGVCFHLNSVSHGQKTSHTHIHTSETTAFSTVGVLGRKWETFKGLGYEPKAPSVSWLCINTAKLLGNQSFYSPNQVKWFWIKSENGD